MRVFQKRILSGNPSRSRGPGSNSRKKSASWASNDRKPFGTILIGCLSLAGGVVGTQIGVATSVSPRVWLATVDVAAEGVSLRKCLRSSAKSLAVEYRSEARFESVFRQ